MLHGRISKIPLSLWNSVFFGLEFVCFNVGSAFANLDSVVPVLIRSLAGSAPLVGLAGAVFHLGWTLPQLVIAQILYNRPRKRPYMLAGLVGRVCPWVIAGALWLGLASRPAAMLTLLFVCLSLFAVTDGISSVPWFDIMGRSMSARRRGHVFGAGQAITGMAGIGVGAVVAAVLKRWAFPANYAVLFALWGSFLFPAGVALFLIREPPPESPASEAAPVGGHWFRSLLHDRAFRDLLLCRVLFTAAGLAAPFYVLHAREVLHLPESIIGGFISAQTLAGVASSMVLGWVGARYGPEKVLCVGVVTAVASPALALLMDEVRGPLVRAYPLIYALLGIMGSTYMLGFSNYTLEIAPPHLRTAYVSVINTVVGFLALTPVLGGWLLERTSYPVLFGVAVVLGLSSLVLALNLKKPQMSGSAVAIPAE